MVNLTLRKLMESQGISNEALGEKSGQKPEYINDLLKTYEYPAPTKYVGLVTAAGGDDESKLRAKVEWTKIRELCEERTEKMEAYKRETAAEKEAKDAAEWKKIDAEFEAKMNDYVNNDLDNDVKAAKDAEAAKKKSETKIEGATIEVADAPVGDAPIDPFDPI